jgi:hypothetical protein
VPGTVVVNGARVDSVVGSKSDTPLIEIPQSIALGNLAIPHGLYPMALSHICMLRMARTPTDSSQTLQRRPAR